MDDSNQTVDTQAKANTQANTKKATTPKLKPDFSHRLGLFDGEATAFNLTGAVDALALQADAVITMLGAQFLSDEEAAKLSDDVIFWTLESVRVTVKDIKAIVTAYHLENIEQTDNQQA